MRRGIRRELLLGVVLALLPGSAAAARAAHEAAHRHSHPAAHPRSHLAPLVSLPRGPAPRPGPPILYRAPAVAPQLTNAGVWHAKPTLVSGAEAYRSGEFLYQDWLYDDHGARELSDPNNPMDASEGDLFSKPNGTYTYPTDSGYAGNAADLVEFRVKPLRRATAFRITLNTLKNPALIAFSIAIGGTPGQSHAFPDGANVRAPAALFLTVHPAAARLVAELVRAGSDQRVPGPAPRVAVDLGRRQIQVEVPHREWNPGRSTVRLAMGVGLWDASARRYLLPGVSADATSPGGAGTAAAPAAFFNVAFRPQEPLPKVTDGIDTVLDAAWWRDRDQGTALAAGDISPFFADVSFAKLARRVHDDSQVPRSGPLDMILPSHFELGQGLDFSHTCGLSGRPSAGSCTPEYLNRLQPFAIYVPPGPAPPTGWGMTLLLHSLSANYNQYSGSRNQSQFARRARPSIVITPEARGPDQFYEGLGAADVFEVWAMVAHMYRLDPSYSDITGYSMGGIGTFTLGEQFPDLFARAQPTVGDSEKNDLVASLRNLPVLMWNNSADELVGPELYVPTASALANLGYRYELDVYRPCVSTLCSPLFPDHLELAINDQFAPAAAFLGSATADVDPAHVTYVEFTPRNVAKYGIVGDHAYWISGLAVRDPSAKSASGQIGEGEIDALSHGFGLADPAPSAVRVGAGTLTGGNLGPLQYASFAKAWAAGPTSPKADTIDLTATNLATAVIAVRRARVDCSVKLNVRTDGPIAIKLSGCGRTVHAG
jgi:hypothetical protein